MTIKLLAIGKTDQPSLQQLIADYQERLQHYVRFEMELLPDIRNRKNLSESQQRDKEAELLLKRIVPADRVALLDETGKTYSSLGFAKAIQKVLNSGIKQWVLVIGGPYGFGDALYTRAQEKISLSAMTFSHQMVRLILLEQLYRAFTILHNEPYHHQ